MKLRQYIREMVETELNEMAAIATLEKIKSPEKLEKFKKLYTGNENSLVSKLIDTIEKGSVKIADAEKAASNPKAQEVIEFINAFNSKPGFREHPIPVTVLTKEFGSIDDLVSGGILSKVEGATRNGMLVATNKSHTAGISPILRDLSRAGVLSDPKAEGEYITPKKEKPEPSGVKGRPTSEKVLVAKALASKFEADSDYKPNEEELAMFADKPDFIERLRSQVNGTLKRGPKNALKNAMQGLASFGNDNDGDGDVDNEDIKENESSDLKVEWTPEYYKAIEEYGDEAYDEKGLATGFTMKNGKKVKEIIGYYVPEGGNSSDEDFDIIGHIYSTSGKDIESYSEDELDSAFTNNLMENENTSATNWTDFEEWEGACEHYFETYGLMDLKAFESEVYDNGDAQNNLAFEIAKEAGFKGDIDDLINNHKFNVYCNMLAKHFLLLYGAMVYVVEENDPKYKKELDYVTSWLNSHKDDSKSLNESKKSKNKKPLNEQFLRMQKIAGLLK